MFDTHAHLQFSAFEKNADEVIAAAKSAGVTHMMVPSTDVATSRAAVELAQKHENVYVAVGIHPHHIFEYQTKKDKRDIKSELKEIEHLLSQKKVIAVGEVGVDRYYYTRTKYTDYEVTSEFIDLQKDMLMRQIALALLHDKRLILHNRQAKADLLDVLDSIWDSKLEGRTVLHCCEPDLELLDFAKEHKICIGVDGDITYDSAKADFIACVPLNILVLETDSPYLLPEPLRSQKKFPNTPSNLELIAQKVADVQGISVEEVKKITTNNAMALFLE